MPTYKVSWGRHYSLGGTEEIVADNKEDAEEIALSLIDSYCELQFPENDGEDYVRAYDATEAP